VAAVAFEFPISTYVSKNGPVAPSAEGGVEAAVGVEPHDGEVVVAAEVAEAHHDDLPVDLEGHGIGDVDVAERGDQAPVAVAGRRGRDVVERRVQRAVGIEPRHREVVIARADRDDPPVRLHDDVGRLVGAAEIDRDPAIATEPGVQRASVELEKRGTLAVTSVVMKTREENRATGVLGTAAPPRTCALAREPQPSDRRGG
jgi:hypothetical protein